VNRKVLVIDNYDSFVYNLVHLIAEISAEEPTVVRNDHIDVKGAAEFDRILLSPGPGIPEEAGNMLSIIRELAPLKSIFGVCLGHQAIGESFGARLENMADVCHGKGVETTVVKPDALMFRGVSASFVSARYHSWVVSPECFPDDLIVTATDPAGRIMGIQHRVFDVHGLQFHPESVLTKEGPQMLRNWLGV
jgi:anthranilate synthase component 2